MVAIRISPARGSSLLSNYGLVALVGIVAVAAVIWGPKSFPEALRLPVGNAFETGFSSFAESAPWAYEPFAAVLEQTFEGLLTILSSISPVILASGVVLAVAHFRGLKLAGLTALLFAWVVLGGFWDYTVETIAFMLVAVSAAFVLGILVGLIGSLGPRTSAMVRLLLDAMQAFPAFAYLVPVVFLFGMGNAAALVVTVIWALPPLARMTSVGLRNVSPEVLEAATSLGTTRRQLLFGVKLPMAEPSIRAGSNQMIMYAIAMATMAAMVGAAGLGAPIWSGLNRLAFGDALQAGVALVLVAVIIDRATAPREVERSFKSHRDGSSSWLQRFIGFFRAPYGSAHVCLALFLLTVLASQVLRGRWQYFSDPPWGVPLRLREPVEVAVLWATTTWGPFLDSVSGVIQTYGLNLLGSFFAATPWALVVGITAAVGILTVGRIQGLVLGLGVAFIGCLGMWEATVLTMTVVTVALVLVILIGFPLGVLMAMNDTAAAIIRPVLDIMQTLPIYLLVIPAVMLLGVGEVAAVLATFIAAVPPMIRFTNAGLRGADHEVIEAAQIFGARPGQILRQIRIPMGLQTMMVGLNQALLLALAMAVVSAMIGAPGLGANILTSVNRALLGTGMEAGLAMFLLGVVLDRLFNGCAQFIASAQHASMTKVARKPNDETSSVPASRATAPSH
ncbi:glycine betaine/proline transport system permease protein [Arthrobacter sp. V1I9]|uniref:ABC transporter permease n=1 Tax=Arthrobacter sp. V1I9 TaxID=3042275 RepID=UPI0027944364|nr:ABC transporter permease subunit [Arthrobacter sp. V1I9]MDQ0867801.1 glycine betaine/proline transport system permease protein [Arthrobacter sp. V1I9]